VVIPTHDRAHLVGDAVRSALAQTQGDLEVIVVDDGSTDGTASVIAAIDDPRVRFLRQPHLGIGAARNHGIRAARGRYLAFLDSDDLWLPDLLANEVPLLDADPGVALVHARARAVGLDGRPRAKVSGQAPRAPAQPLASLLYGNSVATPTALVRRASVEAAGLCDEGLVARVDWDLWLRVARAGEVAFVDGVLALFREHPGRTTGRHGARYDDVIRSRARVLDNFFTAPDVPEAAQAVRSVAYRNAHVEATVQWLRIKRWREAWRSLRAASASAPGRWDTALRVAWVLAVHTTLSRTATGVRIVALASRIARRLRPRL